MAKTTTTTAVNKDTGLPQGVLDTLSGEMGGIYDNLKGMDISKQQYAGMNDEQKKALKKLSDSGQLKQFANAGGNALLGAVGGMNQGQQTMADAASGKYNIKAGDVTGLATQLVDQGGLQANIDAMEGDVNRQLQEGALPSIYRNAAGTGNVGSSRSAIAQGIAQRGAADAVSKNSGLLRAQATADATNRAQTILGGNQQTQLNAGKDLAGLASSSIGQLGETALLGEQATQNQLTAGTAQQTDKQNQLNVDRQNELMKKLKDSGVTDAQSIIELLSGFRGVADTGASTTTSTNSGISTGDLAKETLITTGIGVGANALANYFSNKKK